MSRACRSVRISSSRASLTVSGLMAESGQAESSSEVKPVSEAKAAVSSE